MAVFALEFVLKVISMGFIVEKGSYLRDVWNWLDFVVVVSSFLIMVPSLRSISALRVLKLLRTLRSLTIMPNMKVLVSALFESVAQLGGVLVLAIFFFTIFAILGVSLWHGKLHYRCRMTDSPVNGEWQLDEEDTALCSSVR